MVTPFSPQELPTDTKLVKSYEYSIDVLKSGGTAPEYADGEWLRVRFLSAVDPDVSNVEVDGATYEDKGSPHPIVTGENWTLNFTIQLHRKDDGSFLEEVEEFMKRTRPGANNSIVVRWYDDPRGTSNAKPNKDEAYVGTATVTIKRGETGNAGIGTCSITLTGQGPRVKTKNPLAADA